MMDRNGICFYSRRVLFGLSYLLFSVVGGANAFPPAPNYTLYGTVRDQYGQTITADNAELILLKDGVEAGRAPIRSGLLLDQNYELKIRIDQNLSGPLYSEKAVPSTGAFSLVVDLNGALFYPIEVAGNLTAGKGGERVRLDLNLGSDGDGDGLPDIWEQWQLFQAGYTADAQGNWPLHLIDWDGDLDGDGQKNGFEYVAGTFAGDATETLELEMKENDETGLRFEFYAITGKTYTIERSLDVATWSRVLFSVGTQPGTKVAVYRATGVGLQSAFVVPTGGEREFFQLTVR